MLQGHSFLKIVSPLFHEMIKHCLALAASFLHVDQEDSTLTCNLPVSIFITIAQDSTATSTGMLVRATMEVPIQ